MFLWIIFFHFLLSPPGFAAKPLKPKDCSLTAYVASVVGPDLPELGTLDKIPKKIYFVSDPEKSAKSFAFADAAWKKRYAIAVGDYDQNTNLDLAWDMVEELEAGVYQKVRPAIPVQLKKIQIFAQTIQDSFSLFDNSHQPPLAWPEFFLRLKNLNATILTGDVPKIRIAADEMSKSMAQLPDTQMLKKLSPIHASDFKAYASENFENPQSTFEKNKLTSPEYHHLQKETQKLVTYFQAQQAMDPSPEGQSIVEFFKNLLQKNWKPVANRRRA